MRSALDRMDLENQSELVRLGSLVKTSISNYFISASLGVLKAGHESYFAISLQSPIGQLLLGKKGKLTRVLGQLSKYCVDTLFMYKFMYIELQTNIFHS